MPRGVSLYGRVIKGVSGRVITPGYRYRRCQRVNTLQVNLKANIYICHVNPTAGAHLQVYLAQHGILNYRMISVDCRIKLKCNKVYFEFNLNSLQIIGGVFFN